MAVPSSLPLRQFRIQLTPQSSQDAGGSDAKVDANGYLVITGVNGEMIGTYAPGGWLRVTEIGERHDYEIAKQSAKELLRQLVPQIAPADTLDGIIKQVSLVIDDLDTCIKNRNEEIDPARTYLLGLIEFLGLDKPESKNLSDLILKVENWIRTLRTAAGNVPYPAPHRELLEGIKKLARFKSYVHSRLDSAGVPVNPAPDQTKQNGCRIGARLDWLLRVSEQPAGKIARDLQAVLEWASQPGLDRRPLRDFMFPAQHMFFYPASNEAIRKAREYISESVNQDCFEDLRPPMSGQVPPLDMNKIFPPGTPVYQGGKQIGVTMEATPPGRSALNDGAADAGRMADSPNLAAYRDRLRTIARTMHNGDTTIRNLNRRIDELVIKRDQIYDLLEIAWGVIANASGGNWELQSGDWQSAAVRFRGMYHDWLSARGLHNELEKETVDSKAELDPFAFVDPREEFYIDREGIKKPLPPMSYAERSALAGRNIQYWAAFRMKPLAAK